MESSKLSDICKIYSFDGDLPKEMAYVIQNPNKYDKSGRRVMTIEEILDANDDIGIDFAGLKLIPFVDCFDNDYVCFDMQGNNWTLFNSVDEVKFRPCDKLDDLLN